MPAAHARGGEAVPPVPDGHANPATHGAQSLAAVALVASLYAPAGHAYWEGDDVPGGQKWPVLQLEEGAEVRPVPMQAAPAGQGRQAAGVVPPGHGLYVPLPHGVPLPLLPGGHHPPGGQGVHTLLFMAPSTLPVVPGAHG